MNNNCGCNKTNGLPANPEYLMIQTTASEASSCDPSAVVSGVENCAKQEPMYDISLGSFLVPESNSTIGIQVCNPAIYRSGMWLQFIAYGARLQINSIIDNILTLVNRCPDGLGIDANAPGMVIAKNAEFVVVDAPDCKTEAEKTNFLNSAFLTVKQICVPQLLTSLSTATIRPVGRVESDEADTAAGKCIKAIYGILFKKGTPILTALKVVSADEAATHRSLVKNKTTNEVVEINNHSESTIVDAGKQYFISITKTEEKVIGPAYAFRPFDKFLKENTTALNPATWPIINTSYEEEFLMNSISEISELKRNGLDHIYVNVRLEIGSYGDSRNTLEAKLNDIKACRAGSLSNKHSFNSVTFPVKVNVSDWKLTFKLDSSILARYVFRISISGVWF